MELSFLSVSSVPSRVQTSQLHLHSESRCCEKSKEYFDKVIRLKYKVLHFWDGDYVQETNTLHRDIRVTSRELEQKAKSSDVEVLLYPSAARCKRMQSSRSEIDETDVTS